MTVNYDDKNFEMAKIFVNNYIANNPAIAESNQLQDKVDLLAKNLLLAVTYFNKWEKNKDFNASRSNQHLSEEAELAEIAQQIFKQEAVNPSEPISEVSNVVDTKLSPYTFINQDWTDVEIVQKAKGGVRGAWFFVHHVRGSVVVKGQENADQQVMGTVFLREMGMNVPDSKMVNRDSLEGQQLSSLGQDQGLNARDPIHYMVMDRVRGPAYADLLPASDDIQLVIDNLEKLGELAIYDLVLGNYDRFQLNTTSFNAGNIMFEKGGLRPIDTDCAPQDEETLQFTKYALRKIIREEGDFSNKIALKLARNLGEGINPEWISSDKIKEGMQKAISQLCELNAFRKQQFVSNCRERGCQLEAFPTYVEDLLSYIKSLV